MTFVFHTPLQVPILLSMLYALYHIYTYRYAKNSAPALIQFGQGRLPWLSWYDLVVVVHVGP